MTLAQRYWLAGFLSFVAIMLAGNTVLDWETKCTAYDEDAKDRLVVSVARRSIPEISLPNSPDAVAIWDSLTKYCSGGVETTGLYWRRQRSTYAFYTGLIAPVFLIGVAGFVALGQKSNH